MKNYYDILGIKATATDDEIKKAFRLLSQKLHPDKNDANPFFDEMFKNLNEAYHVLIDFEKRKLYDKDFHSYNTRKPEIIEVEFDNLCYDAVALILIHQQASVVFLQQKLKIGYGRASKIIEELEELEIIGPNDRKGRLILVDKIDAIQLLTRKVSNFSMVHFLEKYMDYDRVEKVNVDSSFKNDASVTSVWDGVRTARKVRNAMWIINILLLAILIYKSKYPDSLRKVDTESKYEYDGASAIVISPSGLNIRIEANSSSAVLGTVPYNKKIYILDKNGPSETISGQTASWIKIDYNGKVGWIWSGFVKMN